MEARELKFAVRREGVEKELRGPRIAGRPEARGRRRAEAQPAARRLGSATAALPVSSPRPPRQGENEPRDPPGDGPETAVGGREPLSPRRLFRTAVDSRTLVAGLLGLCCFVFTLALCRIKVQ